MKKTTAGVPAILKNGKKAAMPENLEPMLATLVAEPVSGAEWLYEMKWDGYRAVAYLKGQEVDLRSRNNKSFNEKFYPLHAAMKQWNMNAVVDGEIVVVNEKGIPDFSDLQQWRSEADGHLVYYAFDLLWYEGISLMHLPLHERREVLKSIMPEDPSV